MASVNSHTGSATMTHRTNNGSDVVLGDHRPFKTQRSDHLKTWSYCTSWLNLTLHPKMSQTCSIGARSGFLADHGSVTMFWFLVSLWTNALRSCHTTVWHINRYQKAQKQYSNTLYSQNTMWKVGLIKRVQKLLTGWNCPTFHARYKYGYSLISYRSFVTNRPVVMIFLIKLLDPKNGNWTGKKLLYAFLFFFLSGIF